jgi:hypothetical protein
LTVAHPRDKAPLAWFQNGLGLPLRHDDNLPSTSRLSSKYYWEEEGVLFHFSDGSIVTLFNEDSMHPT